MGTNKIKTVDMSESIEELDAKSKKQSKKTTENLKEQAKEEAKSKKPKTKKVRSKRYQLARGQVDKTKTYAIDRAIELVLKLSSPKHPTLTADINYHDEKFSGEVSLPHSTGKTLKVAIADDKLLEKVAKGDIDFDVLLAEPSMMSKVAKHAKTLGPKGLMPNPKNQTVTKNPQKRKKELEAGKLAIKTERKAPIIHVQIGQTTQKPKQIQENIESLVKFLNPNKISRLTLSSTMSPGVKIDLSSFSTA